MVERPLSHGLSTSTDVPDSAGRVAILMRTRDRPVLLARALAGVLAQLYPHWHLLLVNDGGDADAVDALVSRHETGFQGRITVLHQAESRGMRAALDAALSIADRQGGFDHVAVHDDDDSWHPLFLDRTTTWLAAEANRSCAAVLTHWTVVREQVDRQGALETGRTVTGPPPPVVRFDALLGRSRFPSIAVLLRRATLAESFETATSGSGDWDLMLRVMAAGEIGVLPQPLAFQHRRDADALPSYLNHEPDDPDGSEARSVVSRNARLRAAARTDPSALVVLGALGAQAETRHGQAEEQRARILANLDRNGLWGHARHEDLQARLIRVEDTLARIERTLLEMRAPRPVPAWRRLAGRVARRLAPGLIDRMRRGSA